MSGNADFDVIASTTLKNYQSKLADNVTKFIPFLNYMKTKGKVKYTGEALVEQLLEGFVPTTSYSGTTTVSLANQSGITAAEYNWKHLITPVVILHTEKRKNAGKNKIIDLMEAKIQQAESSMMNAVSEMLFGDGTGNGGADILGLEAIIAQDPTTGVLGGIDPSVSTYWRNKANTSVGSFASGGIAALSTLVRQASQGADRTDLIITGSTIFGYMASTAYNRAFFDNPKLADLGFQALKFEGIDVIYDENCPSDRVYGINTKYLKLNVNPEADFKVGKFIEPADEPLSAAKIELDAQLTTNCRKRHWVASGITA